MFIRYTKIYFDMASEKGRKIHDEKRVTTMKISEKTKARLDNLKANRSESYEEVLKRILSILSICRVNPEAARSKLRSLDIIKDNQ